MYKFLVLLLLASCGSVYVEEIGEDSEESNEPAQIISYEIGDIGPSGGWIFYKNPIQEEGTWRYLEVSDDYYEFSNIPWDTSSQPDFLDTSVEIGAGLANTQIIFDAFVNSSNDILFAALVCVELEVSYENRSYTNWFLPSLKEVQEIYKNLFYTDIADFETGKNYLSSSDYQGQLTSLVWLQRFDSGVEDPTTTQILIPKNIKSPDFFIRCARFVY